MKTNLISTYFILLVFAGIMLSCASAKSNRPSKETTGNNSKWEKENLLFEDSGSELWSDKWFLDGTRATIVNSQNGMLFSAGSEYKNDTCHAVLWTKQSFEGNILIAYDYTRTDTSTHGVNILYFLATGRGDEEYPTDVYDWREKRSVPAMRTYFRNMNTYHISYATNNDQTTDKDYLRLRRYDPVKQQLKGSEILPDNFDTGLFKTGITYHIEVSRFGNQIEMKVANLSDPTEEKSFEWDASEKPPCEEGRIGLRHMYTRSARYKNFKVWSIK